MELAGLKRIFVVPQPHPHHHDDDDDVEESNSNSKKNKNKKKSKKNNTLLLATTGKHKLMMCNSSIRKTIIFPVRRLCLALSTTINHCKNGAGLVKLQDDVQTCEYQDVQVMWEMLHKTETNHLIDDPNKRKQLRFWRLFLWSTSNQSSSKASSLTC